MKTETKNRWSLACYLTLAATPPVVAVLDGVKTFAELDGLTITKMSLAVMLALAVNFKAYLNQDISNGKATPDPVAPPTA